MALLNSCAKAGHGDAIHEKTGLLIDAYFSATKIRWILTMFPVPSNAQKMAELLFDDRYVDKLEVVWRRYSRD